MKRIIFLVLLLSTTMSCARKPVWVKMMDGSRKANYFKAIKKYDRYWARHFTPGEEEERENAQKLKDDHEHDPRPLLVRIFQSEERGKEKSQELLIEYKGFKKWKMEMMPYVKSDGSIMTPEERVAAWNQLKNL